MLCGVYARFKHLKFYLEPFGVGNENLFSPEKYFPDLSGHIVW